MLLGHETIVARFQRAIANGRLASTFLFVGSPGIGKRRFSLELAQALLCDRTPPEKLAPCGECPSCRQVLAGTHPDVLVVRKPADKATIPLKLLIGEDETRMREGLCYDLASKPYSGKRKIAIIDDADALNKEGANCLLKTLEEPPPRSVLILIGTSEQRQLPTIRSRCQIVRFQPLVEEQVAELLVQSGQCEDAKVAQEAARLSGGSLERANLWCDEAALEFRRELFELLVQPAASSQAAAKRIGQFVDEGGKDSAAKRKRLRLVVSLAEEFYRWAVLVAEGGSPSHDGVLSPLVDKALWWMAAEAPAACLDVCLDAYEHIDANVNQATLLEWLVDQLAETARTGRYLVLST
jgi:DNA polymerase III subunit delta'